MITLTTGWPCAQCTWGPSPWCLPSSRSTSICGLCCQDSRVSGWEKTHHLQCGGGVPRSRQGCLPGPSGAQRRGTGSVVPTTGIPQAVTVCEAQRPALSRPHDPSHPLRGAAAEPYLAVAEPRLRGGSGLSQDIRQSGCRLQSCSAERRAGGLGQLAARRSEGSDSPRKSAITWRLPQPRNPSSPPSLWLLLQSEALPPSAFHSVSLKDLLGTGRLAAYTVHVGGSKRWLPGDAELGPGMGGPSQPLPLQ